MLYVCRRDGFQAVGGCDEKLFAAEELALGEVLKRVVRLVILRQSVTTSGRKMPAYSGCVAMRSRKGLDSGV